MRKLDDDDEEEDEEEEKNKEDEGNDGKWQGERKIGRRKKREM